MLKQFNFTLECTVSIRDITLEDAERAYRGDPNVGCYLEDPRSLAKVIAQQRRLLYSILNQEEVLRRLVRRYVYEYIEEHIYEELPKTPEVDEEMFLVIAEAIDSLDFVDRALYLSYAAPRPEHETDDDGDPFEQHTRLVRNSFTISLSDPALTEIPVSENP